MKADFQSGYDGLLLDLDGVVYVGADAIPGAVEAIGAAQQAGQAVGYLTNNASRPAAAVARHLRDLGLHLADDAVVTSAQIAADLVAARFGRGATVLAVGGPGVVVSLEAAGLVVVGSADDAPAAVVQGYGADVSWRDLAEAAFAVQGGAHWVATNTDLTIPQPRGIAPGNGSLVAAVRQAVGVDPEVAGKPQAVAFTAAAARLGSSRPLVVGDRLDTDIEGGNAAGFDTLMVLTGVHGFDDLLAAPPQRRPNVIADDLSCLAADIKPVTVESGRAGCGAVMVSDVDGQVRVTAADNGADDSGRVDLIRAVLALVWSAAEAGRRLVIPADLRARCGSRTVGSDG